jgi:hypothetical protein
VLLPFEDIQNVFLKLFPFVLMFFISTSIYGKQQTVLALFHIFTTDDPYALILLITQFMHNQVTNILKLSVHMDYNLFYELLRMFCILFVYEVFFLCLTSF